ncbi:MAG: dephospho-CoA kinase [Clostridiales bacterium]|nr:dephospho-CoA kinase [Clostridiales bacterium]
MKPYVLGVTGPTGSGKSDVCALLCKSGFVLIDTDRIAREVMEPPSPLLPLLAAEFGGDVLCVDGSLDRKALAAKAFSTREGADRLNRLTHPAIINEAEQRIEEFSQRGDARILVDAPLLYESGGDRLCDAVLAVVAKDETRLVRIMGRDGISKEEALARMGAQMTCAQYAEKADFVLWNDQGRAELAHSVEQLLTEIAGREALSL